MIGNVLGYGAKLIAFILLQVIVLNNIHFGGFVTPYLYVAFLLLLPFHIPNWLVLVLAFFLGIIVDIFSSTLGMHTGACVFMGFARNYVLRLLEPRDGYDYNYRPTLGSMGLAWYLTYAVSLVFVHHLFLFFAESFSFSRFFSTFYNALLSTIFSMLLILMVQLFGYKSSSKS